MNHLILAAIMLLSTDASALTLKFGAASDIKNEGVTLSNTAILEEDGKSFELTRVADGLREKKVVLVWAKVYVAQIFTGASTIEKSSGQSAIDSIFKNRPAAISLTFLRDVEPKKVIDAFRESLAANGIMSTKEPYQNFLDEAVKLGGSKKGSTIWLVFGNAIAAAKPAIAPKGKSLPPVSKEQVSFYTSGRESVSITASSEEHLVKNMLSIWLGKTTDSGLEKLKSQFLK